MENFHLIILLCTMNEDITELVLNFRESMRHLWNSHAQYLNGNYRFGAIEDDYFYLSVIHEAQTSIPYARSKTENYYSHIAVTPIYKGYLNRFLLGRNNESGGHDIDYVELKEDLDLSLRFIRFSDLAGKEQRDFRYAVVFVLEANQAELVGNVLYLESESVKYEAINA